jgi:pimeloyl-ACP methyl ester carboxylesterase
MVTTQVNHFLRTLIGFEGSYALISESSDADTAVVFVHGFGGNAKTTWLDFQSLIDLSAHEFPWWRHCDAFFYEYSSTGTPIAVSADRLLGFVRHIFPDYSFCFGFNDWFSKWCSDVYGRPGLDLGPEPALPTRTYRKLILVGHSEGAVVIRRAMVQLVKTEKHNMPPSTIGSSDRAEQFLRENRIFDARLILFGPAYLGASCSGWIGVLLHLGILGGLVRPILQSLAAYVDLQKGSPVLESIRHDTEHNVAIYRWASVLTAQAVYGEKDRIVYIGEYRDDPAALIWKEHDHFSVCKPHLGFKEPVEIVRYESKRKASSV